MGSTCMQHSMDISMILLRVLHKVRRACTMYTYALEEMLSSKMINSNLRSSEPPPPPKIGRVLIAPLPEI